MCGLTCSCKEKILGKVRVVYFYHPVGNIVGRRENMVVHVWFTVVIESRLGK